jgi:hypothetical protein
VLAQKRDRLLARSEALRGVRIGPRADEHERAHVRVREQPLRAVAAHRRPQNRQRLPL